MNPFKININLLTIKFITMKTRLEITSVKIMKKIFFAALLFLMMSACAQQPPEQPSLYERLGGTEGISSIVDDVVAAHLQNPTIKAIFIPYKDQPERLEQIKANLVDFFGAGTGGTVSYTGRDMPTAHRGMNINPAEYMAVMDDIMMVLGQHNIDDQSKKEVLFILWSLKGTIMGQ